MIWPGISGQDFSFSGFVYIVFWRWLKADVQFIEVHRKCLEVYLKLIKVHLREFLSYMQFKNDCMQSNNVCISATFGQMWNTPFHPPVIGKNKDFPVFLNFKEPYCIDINRQI